MSSVTSNGEHRGPVGLIGLGLMGAAMAARLQDAGYEVIGWDMSEARRRGAASAAEVFDLCQRVILSLPDSDAVREVLLGGSPMCAGKIILDTTTGDPDCAIALERDMLSQGVHYLDATVSGSSAQMANGSAVFIVGGAAGPFERCADLFACLGTRAFHTGACGTGARMKLVSNLVLGLNRAALAEGLAFAFDLDLDPVQTLAILRGSMAYSRIMDTKGEKMLMQDFTPQARLSQHLKDVRLMLAATEMTLPLSEAHRALLEKAEALGCGDLDNSAIIRAYE